jgi:hypothetical protein
MPNVKPPPVPRTVMTDSDGRATRPWIAWFTTLRQIFGFYQTVQSAGTDLAQRLKLNFSSAFVLIDNKEKDSTDVSLPTVKTTQTAITIAFGGIYQNTTDTTQRIYLTIQTNPSSAGTATVLSDSSPAPTTQIGSTSVLAVGGSPAVNSLVFEVLPGNYYQLTQDSGTLSIPLAIEVQ